VGIPTVGVEMTGAGGCLEEDVSADYDGVLNLLRFLGVLRDRAAPEMSGSFRTITNVFAPCPGYVLPLCAVGDQVQAGTVVTQILSPFGETVAEVTTPHSGEVWVMRHLRRVTAGEMVCAVSGGSET
jgi:predicted deacylase